MKSPTWITTSWDDGHPLDLRVAELLDRHGLRGTFYVPREATTGTMTTAQLRELSSAFEVGAHTLRHVALTLLGEEEARQEIEGSRAWVEEITGKPCRMFCPPRGKFSARDLSLIHEAGFVGARTVELLSIAYPQRCRELLVMPTSVQAHPHGLLAYTRNALRRRAFPNLWRYIVNGPSSNWARVAQSLLGRALRHGGVFHLWGHSWELERGSQWQRLEEVLCFLGEHTAAAPALTNGQVCEASLHPPNFIPSPVIQSQPREGSPP
jgi:hypothetical protein